MCYKHHGFWQCMDTLRDKEKLEKMWAKGEALWNVWEDEGQKNMNVFENKTEAQAKEEILKLVDEYYRVFHIKEEYIFPCLLTSTAKTS